MVVLMEFPHHNPMNFFPSPWIPPSLPQLHNFIPFPSAHKIFCQFIHPIPRIHVGSGTVGLNHTSLQHKCKQWQCRIILLELKNDFMYVYNNTCKPYGSYTAPE